MGGKKRPCSICRRWFTPDPRVRGRQTTCSSAACQKARRARTQRRWTEKNPSYQTEYRLRITAEQLESGDVEMAPLRGSPAELSKVPWSFAKDSMGSQGVVFIAYLSRLFIRSGKDPRRSDPSVITGESVRHLLRGAKDQTDRRSAEEETSL